MTKPTYEELETEVARLREKLSGGADEDFTKEVRLRLSPLHKSLSLFFEKGLVRAGKITARPSEIWEVAFPCDGPPTTRDLAKLGRSLQALGWARSAKQGNLVFTISEAEYVALGQ